MKKKTNLINSLIETDKYAIGLASEKGGSNWLNALPLSRYNFNLNKSEFRDGIYLRYGREPTKTPPTCACGAEFKLTHALHCAKRGYTHIRHNEIKDTFANLMNEVCHDVEIEPKLQPLQAKALSTIQLQLKMRHDLTLRQTDSGVYDSAVLSLM